MKLTKEYYETIAKHLVKNKPQTYIREKLVLNYKGEVIGFLELCKKHNINKDTVRSRLCKGKSLEEALLPVTK